MSWALPEWHASAAEVAKQSCIVSVRDAIEGIITLRADWTEVTFAKVPSKSKIQ